MGVLAVAFVAGRALAAPATQTAPTKSSESTKTLEFSADDPGERQAQLTAAKVEALVRKQPKTRDWLSRYAAKDVTWQSTYDYETRRWRVKAWATNAGQIVDAKVDDVRRTVFELWTGPQVAWGMARGRDGAFGGKQINSVPVWLLFCVLFIGGLANWRKPLSLRNLDLLVLLSFSVSLWFFNQGDIFTSVPLVYPPLIYLIARTAWVGWKGRLDPEASPLIPTMVLAAAAVFLVGFRVGLNLQSSNVIDVGYAGVIGGDRILDGSAPWGHFPGTTGPDGEQLLACGGVFDGDGNPIYRKQPSGVCEQPNAQGDTYGPVAYLSYIPGVLAFGWTGYWDDLPAAHFSSIAFDLLCVLGLFLIGLRFGDRRLGVTFAFAWLAYPFTQYISNSNTNDALPPLFLIWGFLALSHAWGRGAGVALSTWSKFTTGIVAPLWATYPRGVRDLRRLAQFVAGFLATTLAVFALLLLEPSLGDAIRTFWDRTLAWQLDRRSPFSLWDWGQYHAEGIPDLKILQRFFQAAVLIAAVVLAFVPRERSPLRLAAFTAALILGSQLVLTHWFYLYIPWFFPFVTIAVLGTSAALAKVVEEEVEEPKEVGEPEPAPA